MITQLFQMDVLSSHTIQLSGTVVELVYTKNNLSR